MRVELCLRERVLGPNAIRCEARVASTGNAELHGHSRKYIAWSTELVWAVPAA